MKIIFYLSTCDTCKRILDEIKPGPDVVLQDIKANPASPEQLELMKNLAGSYQSLFSKVARKFRAMGLHEMQLKESDYKRYLSIEYTFLKRPVTIVGNKIFIGNSDKAVADAKQAIHEG